jgi:FixJ family two-component response regulator
VKTTASRSDETVFIVDDDPDIRAGLSDLLDSAGLRTRCFPSAEEFFKSWNAAMPGCLVLDVRLPGMTGMELQSKLAEVGATIPVIIMTAHGDVPMVRKALKAGAVEFLEKPFQDEELLQAVDQAFSVDRARRHEDAILNAIQARIASLSDREREVMKLVTAGLLNKQIAAELNLSEITVKVYRRHVMDGMQAGSVAELVKMCERAGFPSGTDGRARYN